MKRRLFWDPYFLLILDIDEKQMLTLNGEGI